METMQVTSGGEKRVLGVLLSKVSEAVVREAYGKEIGKQPGKKTTEQIVEGLMSHFLKRKSEGLLECTECYGGSTKEWEACPFCGIGDEDAVAADADASDDSPPTPEPPTPPAAPHKAPRKKRAVAAPEENGHAAVLLAPVHSAELIEPVSAKELDEAVRRINAISIAQSARGLWMLGRELLDVYDRELWRQRNDEGGKPKYKAFDQFLRAEVDLHPRTVFRMMQMTKDFEEPQLERYGSSILKGLLGAPKETRQEILDRVDRGEVKGKRGVQEAVAKARSDAGVEVVEGVGKSKKTHKAAKAASASARARSEAKKNTVTVPFPAGRRFIQAFAKPASKKDEPKRAKRLADQPWAKLECINGVALYVAIVEKDGALGFTLEARREE
jgi:hypothetical protein